MATDNQSGRVRLDMLRLRRAKRLLVVLERMPDSTSSEIQEEMGMSRDAVGRMIRLLHEQGMIHISSYKAVTNQRIRHWSAGPGKDAGPGDIYKRRTDASMDGIQATIRNARRFKGNFWGPLLATM